MNWNLFSSELKKQLLITGIKGRALSEKIDRNFAYISQILNRRVKKVDYETSRKIFEELNLIDYNLLDYYLYLLGVDLSDNKLNNVKNSIMYKNKLDTEQCYESVQEPKVDGYKKYKISKEYEEASEAIYNYRKYSEKYSFNKQAELTETINQIYLKLNSYLEDKFDPNDYSNNHNAETILTTLKGLFDLENKNTIPMFEFFLNLMKLPLQTIETVKTQNEILEFINEKCILEYRFDKISDIDNDPKKLNQLHLTFKQPTKK